MIGDLKFKHPFTCIISGPTGSGKSTFSIQFLKHIDLLCTEPNFDGGIIWCYSEKTAVPTKQLSELKKNIQFQEGLSDNFGNPNGKPSLIILDDLLNQVYSKDVCDLFTKGSHHRNISLLLVLQKLIPSGYAL
jgi:hypothetical protein